MPAIQMRCYCATLRQAARALTSFYDQRLQTTGIRVTQFTILQALDQMGKARNADLEQVLAMDQTTLTRNLAVLARRGLIAVLERPSGREKLWGMTSAGRKLYAQALPVWESIQAEVASRAGAQQANALRGDVFALTAAFT